MDDRSSRGRSEFFRVLLFVRIVSDEKRTFHPPSHSYVDQLNQILHYLGTPSEETLRRVGSPRVSLNYSFFYGAFLTQHPC